MVRLWGLWLIPIFIISLGSGIGVVAAQNGGVVRISGLQAYDFPQIRFFLEVIDAQGKPVNDLQPDEIQLLEDGFARPVSNLARIQPGLQVILAINESPNLTNQVQGVSYYRLFMQKLESWALAMPPESPGNYSYITNKGTQIVQAADPGLFAQALIAYEPDLLTAQPGLTSLTMALDLTTDPLPDPFMKRAILYITPLPDAAARAALPNIAERAAQLGTRVYIWLIAPGYPLEAPEIAPLRQLADQTRGEVFLYAGTEDFPDPENYFEPLRYIFQVSYDSRVTTSGDHRLVTSVRRSDLQASSEEATFLVNVSPPNPIFLEPPAQIVRSFSEGDEILSLEPEEIPIQILLEFPDGHPRALRYTRLYINELMAVENLSPPFDRFNLPLENFVTNGELRMRVEVEDELGLSQSSIETVVNIIVEEPQQSWFAQVFSGSGLMTVVALSVAALVLVLVILFTSQKNLVRSIARRVSRNRDPVTQPVVIDNGRQKKASATLDSPTVRKPPLPSNAPARLVRLSEDGNPIPQRTIPLIRRETTLGADPQQAICVLDSAAVDPLHARIYQDETGQFFVSDAGSIAGTWVNYDPVNGEGVKLEHSDIIHFALMSFRFELNQPTCVRKPTVIPYRTEQL